MGENPINGAFIFGLMYFINTVWRVTKCTDDFVLKQAIGPSNKKCPSFDMDNIIMIADDLA